MFITVLTINLHLVFPIHQIIKVIQYNLVTSMNNFTLLNPKVHKLYFMILQIITCHKLFWCFLVLQLLIYLIQGQKYHFYEYYILDLNSSLWVILKVLVIRIHHQLTQIKPLNNHFVPIYFWYLHKIWFIYLVIYRYL